MRRSKVWPPEIVAMGPGTIRQTCILLVLAGSGVPSSGRMTHPEPWVMVRQRPIGAPAKRMPMPAPARSTIASVLDHVDANLPASRDNLFDLLRIKSVSAQPVHAPDCVKAAEWWRRSARAGLVPGRRAPDRWPSGGGRPFHRPRRLQGPHVLFYGHYDVQPVDPLSLWHSPRSIRNWSMVPAASVTSPAARWTTKARH